MFIIQIGAVILHQQFYHNHPRLMLFTTLFRGRQRKAYCHCPQCCHHNDSCHSYDANGISICGCDSDHIYNKYDSTACLLGQSPRSPIQHLIQIHANPWPNSSKLQIDSMQ